MPPQQLEAPTNVGEHVGSEGAFSCPPILPAHGHEEGCGEVGGQEQNEFAQEVQGSVGVPQAKKGARPQPDNDTIMALLADIQGMMEAMLMRQNVGMNPQATPASAPTQPRPEAQPIPPPQPRKGSVSAMFAEFLKLHLPTYSGLEDQEYPQEFLVENENTRVALGCASNHMVELASFLLKGKANSW